MRSPEDGRVVRQRERQTESLLPRMCSQTTKSSGRFEDILSEETRRRYGFVPGLHNLLTRAIPPPLRPPFQSDTLQNAMRTTVCMSSFRRQNQLRLQELRFGVEVETVKRRRGDVAQAIRSAVGGEVAHVAGSSSYDPWEVRDEQGRSWKVMADASLSNVEPELRAEVVTPVLIYEDLTTLQEVVRAIRQCGARVDEKCGMHIHVDASAFDGRTLANLAKIIHKQEELILTALGVSEDRLRRYTKPMSSDFIAKIERSRPRTKEQMNRIWYGYENNRPIHYDHTRYHGVNFHSVWYRGTIEFRWFEATLHAGKVKAGVQLVLAIAAHALNSRGTSSKRRRFNPSSAKYDFRVFLIRLGMNGPEFKTARTHLLSAMPGDAAWKNGRPKADQTSAQQAEAQDGTR